MADDDILLWIRRGAQGFCPGGGQRSAESGDEVTTCGCHGGSVMSGENADKIKLLRASPRERDIQSPTMESSVWKGDAYVGSLYGSPLPYSHSRAAQSL
ncbi:hypothetical protein BGE01nite_11180 [Brevifollis gellanilyticus]|uniref:Uncharacterized protein n=1 Tax=Brevifollis gellanilyticus TaxID=748831 RepID=A0A512M523_9BACT|nr:hypothetical protein BGE01nite_11180 [Brevifollis gellanilyticus]